MNNKQPNWQPMTIAPKDRAILVVWGTISKGAQGYDIVKHDPCCLSGVGSMGGVVRPRTAYLRSTSSSIKLGQWTCVNSDNGEYRYPNEACTLLGWMDVEPMPKIAHLQ